MNKKKLLYITGALAFLLVIFSLIAPYVAPNDPYATDFKNVLKAPSSQYPFGTDQVGRCILSRVLCGARVSLGMTFVLLGMIFVSGVTIGVISGMRGGYTDSFIMRSADVILAFPDIVLAIAIVGVLGGNMVNTLIGLSLIWWTKYARLTRVSVMKIKGTTYVQAAEMIGTSKLNIVFKYILPNIFSGLLIQLAVDVSGIMLALSGLSFLGLGVQPPTPEWGNMLNEGRPYIQTAPWLLMYPGLAIFLVVAVFNVLGDSLRDVLESK